MAAIAGCSHLATGGQNYVEEDPAARQQKWALGDGSVTAQEYWTAMDSFLSCVRDAGYRVGAPQLSPVDGLTLVYDITPSGEPARYNAEVQRCNLAHISLIEPGYVESHHQTMEASLQREVAICLRRNGVRLTGRERNFPDFLAAADKDESAVQCTIDVMHRLFPELPDYVTIRG